MVIAEIECLRGERKLKILEALFLGYAMSVNRGGKSVIVAGAIAPISIALLPHSCGVKNRVSRFCIGPGEKGPSYIWEPKALGW